jgi:hypothetical protein
VKKADVILFVISVVVGTVVVHYINEGFFIKFAVGIAVALAVQVLGRVVISKR